MLSCCIASNSRIAATFGGRWNGGLLKRLGLAAFWLACFLLRSSNFALSVCLKQDASECFLPNSRQTASLQGSSSLGVPVVAGPFRKARLYGLDLCGPLPRFPRCGPGPCRFVKRGRGLAIAVDELCWLCWDVPLPAALLSANLALAHAKGSVRVPLMTLGLLLMNWSNLAKLGT
jgi:hypothetical protein